MTITRRGFVAGSLVAGAMLPGCSLHLPKVTPPEMGPGNRFAAMLRQIEGEANGTLGVELVNLATGRSVGINRHKRFGHASSFKLSLAAMVLERHAAGAIDADEQVRWTQSELMHVSPFTTRRLEEGASMRELAEFTQKYSDNTAANVLLRELGGPAALTAFWRSIGDDASRLDRTEPELNNVPLTEFRDTTTPAAMARTVAKLVYGEVLPEAERAALRQWMIDTPTGTRRVRAGLPEGWVAGDKTGTSIWPDLASFYVDIGFAEAPEGRAPITFATYFISRETHEGMDPAAEAALARVGDVIKEFAEPGRGLPLLG